VIGAAIGGGELKGKELEKVAMDIGCEIVKDGKGMWKWSEKENWEGYRRVYQETF
jgi:hypothetical protein